MSLGNPAIPNYGRRIVTDTMKAPEGGPCPPLKAVSEAEYPDSLLVQEAAADYDSEEKDEVTK
jgi:hypothetical protein